VHVRLAISQALGLVLLALGQDVVDESCCSSTGPSRAAFFRRCSATTAAACSSSTTLRCAGGGRRRPGEYLHGKSRRTCRPTRRARYHRPDRPWWTPVTMASRRAAFRPGRGRSPTDHDPSSSFARHVPCRLVRVRLSSINFRLEQDGSSSSRCPRRSARTPGVIWRRRPTPRDQAVLRELLA